MYNATRKREFEKKRKIGRRKKRKESKKKQEKVEKNIKLFIIYSWVSLQCVSDPF